MVNLLHIFPLFWEGHESHRNHVRDTYNLQNHMVPLTVVRKQLILLDYHGCVIYQGSRGFQLLSMKRKKGWINVLYN